MTMRFADRLTVTRPGGATGTQDPVTGVWTPSVHPDAPIFDGAADVQEFGMVIGRTIDGQPIMTGDAKAFLENEKAISRIFVGDVATVTFRDGSMQTASVKRIRRMDGLVALEWLH